MKKAKLFELGFLVAEREGLSNRFAKRKFDGAPFVNSLRLEPEGSHPNLHYIKKESSKLRTLLLTLSLRRERDSNPRYSYP